MIEGERMEDGGGFLSSNAQDFIEEGEPVRHRIGKRHS